MPIVQCSFKTKQGDTKPSCDDSIKDMPDREAAVESFQSECECAINAFSYPGSDDSIKCGECPLTVDLGVATTNKYKSNGDSMSHLQHQQDGLGSEELLGLGEGRSGGDEGKTRDNIKHEGGGEGDGDSDMGAPADSKNTEEERPYRGPSMISSFWNLYEEFIDTQGFSADDDPGRDMFHLNERDFGEYAEFADARRDAKGYRNSFDRPRIDKNGNYIKKGQLSDSDKSISNQTKGKRRVDDEEKQLDQVEVDEIAEYVFNPYEGSTSMASTGHEAAQTLTKDKLKRIEEEKPKELGKYDAKFTQRLVHVAKKEMVGTVQNGNLCVLNLSTMQRMNLHAIQRDIAQFAGEIINAEGNEVDWTRLKELMRDYCQAWQDWSVIEAFAEKKMDEDPFRLLTTNFLSKKLMEDFDILPGKPSKPDDFIVDWTVKDKSFLPAYARHATLGKEKIHKSLKLFAWAAGGGLSLIGPMLLMRLHRTLLTQLLTTSVVVMAFGAIVALLAGGLVPYVDQVNLGPEDVLTATAAYAAVLVVFISQSA